MDMPSEASLPLASGETYRLSPQQRYSWRLQDAVRSPIAQIVLQVTGIVEPESMFAAIEAVCGRHEALRTNFRRTPGMALPFQAVNVACIPAWRCVDLRDLPPDAQDALVLAQIKSESKTPFALESDAALRCLLVELDRDRHLISFTLPAISADRQSLRNLVREFSLIYSKEREALDPEPLQYSEIAQWQDELLESEDQHARDGLTVWHRWVDGSHEHHDLPFQRQQTDHVFDQAALTLELKPSFVQAVDKIAMQSGSAGKYSFRDALGYRAG